MMHRGVFFAVFLCALYCGLDAYAASSVRNLGVGNTYSSASVAANAASVGGSSSATSASLRGGSVRVTSGSGQSGTTTTASNAARVVTTPRLSLGQYLGGGTSVSGGSSIRPQTPSTGSSGSGGDVGTNPGLAGDLREEIEKVREELYQETDTLREADKLLEEEKQNNLVPVDGGYIILDDRTNEISIDIDNLKEAIGSVIGKDGREIELGIQGDYIAWRYVGDASWTALIAIADITGPQGPQGEMGPQGPQGEPGDPADIPTVNNAVLTIQKNGTDVGTFSANASSATTVNITVPTTTSQLTNNSGFITNADLPEDYVLPVATGDNLGGIKSGGNITVNDTGVVTVNSATKATQDASGNVITTTYATQAQLSALDSIVSGTGAVVTGVTQVDGKVSVTKGNIQIPVGSATATTYATMWVE